MASRLTPAITSSKCLHLPSRPYKLLHAAAPPRISLPLHFKAASTSLLLCIGPPLVVQAQASGRPSTTVGQPHEEPSKKPNEKNTNNDDSNNQGFSLPKIPTWARWLLGSLILAIPVYRKFLRIEHEVTKTTEVVAEVVEEVAEAAEKVATEVADSLPEGQLKDAAIGLEKAAEIVDHGAEAIETMIKKVDEVVEEVDAVVEPILQGSMEGAPGIKNLAKEG